MQHDVPSPVRLAAPAKINLFLEVLGRRADGYHELVTCMTPLAWADELTFTASDQMRLTCDDPSLALDDNNLVLKAAKAFQRQTQANCGAAIHLTKRIPSPAGLGGGSSDAATTLRGLNQLWNIHLDDTELMNLAAQIGSDVPFFLAGSAAWCRGRGEQVMPFKLGMRIPLLLACPVAGLSTAAVYQSLNAPPLSVGMQQAQSDIPLAQAIRMSNLSAIGRELFNRLQPAAEQCLPLVSEIRQLFEQAASLRLCEGSLMSGSGSSYFAVCRSQEETQRLARYIQQHWEGGVQIQGMRTMEPKPGLPDRMLRLIVTSTM